MPVKQGDTVTVDYEGTFDDGEVFDSSKLHGQPLEFEVGAKMVVKGFDDAVMGMELNQEKTVKLTPTQGYGDKNPMLVIPVPKDKLPPEAKEGMMLVVGLENGFQVPAMIIQMDDQNATLDMNHPLAGKTLNFKIKLLGIKAKELIKRPGIITNSPEILNKSSGIITDGKGFSSKKDDLKKPAVKKRK